MTFDLFLVHSVVLRVPLAIINLPITILGPVGIVIDKPHERRPLFFDLK